MDSPSRIFRVGCGALAQGISLPNSGIKPASHKSPALVKVGSLPPCHLGNPPYSLFVQEIFSFILDFLTWMTQNWTQNLQIKAQKLLKSANDEWPVFNWARQLLPHDLYNAPPPFSLRAISGTSLEGGRGGSMLKEIVPQWMKDSLSYFVIKLKFHHHIHPFSWRYGCPVLTNGLLGDIQDMMNC